MYTRDTNHRKRRHPVYEGRPFRTEDRGPVATTAAVVCAVIAYWDKVAEFCGCAGEKLRKKTGCPSEYDDYVEE